MQNIKNKAISIALAFLVCLLSVVTVPFGRAYAAEDYHTWRQMDERWGGVGMNGTTIARSGCLITSLSIMIMHSKSLDSTALSNLRISSEDEFNPGVLANAYSARGGFTYGGGIASWGTISQIVPQVTFVRDSNFHSYNADGIAAEIKDMMDSGLHVIVNANGHHWVYIEGIVGNDIYMIDPANDSRLLSDVYTLYGGNEYWALRCANPPGEFTPPDTGESYDELVEYYCSNNPYAYIYADTDDHSERLAELIPDAVVKIGGIKDGFGHVMYKDGDGKYHGYGWVKMTDLNEAGSSTPHVPGDINKDSVFDMIDLSLLSEYISSKEKMPEWASIFRDCEIEAADINEDGVVDNDDLMILLEFLCQ